jgi:isoamylase
VSYDRKHNEDNGEDNRDGSDYNRSWNCGVEGETDDPAINTLRRLQIRNFLTSLLLSTGVPMLLAGDEMGRTQLGNNNAYCQDNEVSWVDWSLLNSWSDIHDLVRALLRLRRAEPVFRQRHFFAGQAAYEGGRKDVAWFGVDGLELTGDQWLDPAQRTLGMFLSGDAIRGRGPHGEPIVGSSFLWWLHADPNSVEVVLPERPWARSYVELLIPQPETPITAGKLLTLPGRSVTLLRAD